MATVEARERAGLDHNLMIKQYQRVLATRGGTILDSVNLPFNGSEFTFFYRLLQFWAQDDQERQEALYEVAFLSTLVYLSTKIHFSISEEPVTEEQTRGELQFPILAGDLLYSCFFAEIIQGEFMPHLEKYTDYLAEFNAELVDYLQQKRPMAEFLPAQLAELARLTLTIYEPAATEEQLALAMELGRAEGGLLIHSTIPQDELALDPALERDVQALLAAMQADKACRISSFADLTYYLTTN